MADTTTDNQTEAPQTDADSLESAVDALIDEIEGVCEAFDRSHADDAPVASESNTESAGAHMVREADEALDAEVDALVAESVGVEEAAVAPAPRASGSIDELDAELAAAADEELAGEFATMDDLEGEAVAPESLGPDPTPEPAPAPEPVAAPVEPVKERSPAPAAQAEPASTPLAEAVQEAAPEAHRPRRSLIEPALRVLAAPLARLTPMQRDTIGWVALNTLFLAACVWVFVLLR
ncbi:MAG: hypothetical protein ACF8QF_10095 [Phycisphaerales bacterium]